MMALVHDRTCEAQSVAMACHRFHRILQRRRGPRRYATHAKARWRGEVKDCAEIVPRKEGSWPGFRGWPQAGGPGVVRPWDSTVRLRTPFSFDKARRNQPLARLLVELQPSLRIPKTSVSQRKKYLHGEPQV